MQQLSIYPEEISVSGVQQTLWKAKVVLLKVGEHANYDWMPSVHSALHSAFDVQELESTALAQGQFLQGEVGCLLLIYSGDESGLAATIQETLASTKGVPLVVLGLRPSIAQAVLALKAGATDYISSVSQPRDQLSTHIVCSLQESLPVPTENVAVESREILQDLPLALLGERSAAAQFSAQAAHEILTPLAALQEFIALVLDGVVGPVADEQGKYLAYARGACVQIQQAVDRLVEPHLVAAKDKKPELPRRLEALVLEAWSVVAESAPETDLSLQLDATARNCEVAADPLKLQQLFLTLFQDLLQLADAADHITLAANLIEQDARTFVQITLFAKPAGADDQQPQLATSQRQLGPWLVTQTASPGLGYRLEVPIVETPDH